MTTLAAVIALNVTGLLALFLYVRTRLRRALDAEGLLADLRREVSALVAELNAEADRDVTLIEDRSAELRRLLEDVERRMAVMRREAATRAGERAVLERLDLARAESRTKPEAAPTNEPRRSWDPLLARGAGVAEPAADARAATPGRGRVSSDARIEEPAGGSSIPPGPAPAPEPETPRETVAGPSELPFVSFSSVPVKGRSDFREEAISLWRKGFSSDLIAARLGSTIAEVDLVVGLEEERGAEGAR